MKITKIIIQSLILMSFCISMPSFAKAVWMEIDGKKIFADVKLRDGNQIRATANVSRNMPMISAGQVTLKAIAITAKEKGYNRFAIVKISDCGTMTMSGVAVYDTCRMLGQMLQPTEMAKPEKGHEIKYYNVNDVVR